LGKVRKVEFVGVVVVVTAVGPADKIKTSDAPVGTATGFTWLP
jgi:hypothetical protein